MHNKISTWLMLGLAGVMAGSSVGVRAQDFFRMEREEPVREEAVPIVKAQVSFQLNKPQDPMLSPDDILLLEHREKQRLAALEAERKRKEEEERKRLAEEERKRQWELALLKDPSILIRDKIHIGGIIDKEVLIGGKLYTIGNTYMGAKIVAVDPDSVTFLYKGHRFVKKVKL